MSVSIKTSEEIDKMRIAGRLASELLDFITPCSMSCRRR
jgi:methionyl aminopeptidase